MSVALGAQSKAQSRTITGFLRFLVPGFLFLHGSALAEPTPEGAAPAEAEPTHEPWRLVDFGLRPLFSFPDAIGATLEVHPLGGRFSLEGGVSMQLLETAGIGVAAKYRFPVYRGKRVVLAVGPGLGSHWLFDGPRGGYLGELGELFAATEAVWWGKYAGFRLALDLGAATPVVDKHYYNRHLETYPVVNSSVGVAFRLGQ